MSVLVQPEEEVAVVLRGDFYMASVLLEQRLRSAGKRSDEVVGSGLVRESEAREIGEREECCKWERCSPSLSPGMTGCLMCLRHVGPAGVALPAKLLLPAHSPRASVVEYYALQSLCHTHASRLLL